MREMAGSRGGTHAKHVWHVQRGMCNKEYMQAATILGSYYLVKEVQQLIKIHIKYDIHQGTTMCEKRLTV